MQRQSDKDVACPSLETLYPLTGIYIYRKKDKQIKRQTDRQTHRHTQTDTHRHTDRHTDT